MPQRLRRRAKHARLPNLHGLPGHLPDPLRSRRAQSCPAITRPERHDPQAPVQVRPQAVLLPGPAQGLPDLTVRRANRGGRPPRRRHPRRRRRRHQTHRHHTRAHRRRRRQAHALPGEGKRTGVRARGLQPRGRRARRDRVRTRPSNGPGSRRLRSRDAKARAVPRRGRREPIGRGHAMRRQRVGTARGTGTVRDQG